MSPTKRDRLILLVAFVVCMVFECFLILAKPQHPASAPPPAVATAPAPAKIERPTGMVKGEKWVPEIVLDNRQISDDSAKFFLQALDGLQEAGADYVLFVINSPGGAIQPGYVMAHAIERSPVPIVCVVDGTAQSMAAYILQSCDVRVMTRRSTLMFHQARRKDISDAYIDDLQDMIDDLRVTNTALVAQYARRMRLTPAQVQAKISHRHMWYLDADEALRVGAVDKLVDSVEGLREQLAKP